MTIGKWLIGTGAALLLSACGSKEQAETPVAAAPQSEEKVQPVEPAQSQGPDILTTVGLYDENKVPLTQVHANQATFTLQDVDGITTLMVNGKPALYRIEGIDVPAPVQANNALDLVGVFELPHESVAWAIVIGGSGCPATHILVGARNGLALPGQEIPGCDDRGTMTRSGDMIAFEAGGSSGTYHNGLVTVERNATAASNEY